MFVKVIPFEKEGQQPDRLSTEELFDILPFAQGGKE
jgi:hypothetical protein